MNVGKLKKELEGIDDNVEIIMSSDPEGNGFSPLGGPELGRYNRKTGESGIVELTEDLKNQGYTNEDVIDGPIAVVLWPEY